MEKLLTPGTILEEINKMVKAHNDRGHKLDEIGIDTLGLLFRKSVIELMNPLNELQEQGAIIINLGASAGVKKRAGTIRLSA